MKDYVSFLEFTAGVIVQRHPDYLVYVSMVSLLNYRARRCGIGYDCSLARQCTNLSVQSGME